MKKNNLVSLWVLFSICLPVVSVAATAISDSPFPTDNDTDLAKRSNYIIVKKRHEPAQAKGIELGGFLFLPSLSLAEYHDDNIYATETNRQKDSVTVISPNFTLKSRWSKHKLDINAGLDVARYADLASENTNDYWLGVSGRYDFSARQNVFGGLNYSREHEDRASPDAEAGDTPTKYDSYRAHLGHAFSFGNHRTRIAYTVNRLDYKNVTSTSGVIDNSDRDRTEQALGLRYLYKYSPSTALFLDGVVDKREYNQTPDFSGNDRNSNGYRYSLGMQYVNSSNLLKVFAGSLARDYQSAAFEDQSAFDFGLDYTWKFGALSRLVVRSGRSIDETTFDNSSGYLMTNASARLQLGISGNKSLHIGAAKSIADYYGIARTDDYYDYIVGYSQQLRANLLISLDLQRSERDSDVAGSDYRINQILLRVSGVI